MKRLHAWLFIPPVMMAMIVFNFFYVELNTSGEIIRILDMHRLNFGAVNGLGIDGMYIYKHSLFGFTPALLFLLFSSYAVYIYKFSHRSKNPIRIRLSKHQIIHYALFSVFIAVLLSPIVLPIKYFENPLYFLVTGSAFSMIVITLWIHLSKSQHTFTQLTKIFLLAMLLGGALSIEIANFFYMSHHEGTNIHRDINGGIIIASNLIPRIYLPGYFLWRGLNYYIIFMTFLLLMERFCIKKDVTDDQIKQVS